MARLWACGYGLQSVAAGIEVTAAVGSPSISTTIKRSGAASLRCNAAAAATYVTFGGTPFSLQATTARTLFYRFYVEIATAPDALTPIWRLLDFGMTARVSVRMNTNRTLELWNDTAGTQIGSDSAAIPLDDFEYRVEVTVTTNASTQITGFSARINGSDFASVTGLTVGYTAGLTTQQAGVIDAVTADLYFADHALNNSDGTAQTTYPGSSKLVYLAPSADGDNAMGARGGTDTGANWSQVSAIAPPDDTSYYVLDINGDVLDVNVEDPVTAGIGSGDTIHCVIARSRRRAASGASMTYATRIKSESGVTSSTGTNITTSDTTFAADVPIGELRHVTYVDPTTGVAWTVTGTNSLDNMQVGASVSDANPDCWISTLYVIVDYTPAGATILSPSAGALALAGLSFGMNFGINIPTDTV